MRIGIGIMLLTWVGLAGAQSDCPEKMGSGDPPPDQFCEVFANTPDTAFLIFTVNFYHYPPDVEYDSAHLALLRQHSEELFSKYDLRHQSDTTVRWVGIPNDALSYGYEYLLMTKRTALEIAREPYVMSLSYHRVPQTVSGLQAKRPQRTGYLSRRFDLMGRAVPGYRPNRRGALSLPRPY